MLRLGLVADDFTGASDAASFLAQAGVPTVLYSGVPQTVSQQYAAAVIALKSRSCPVGEAVQSSLLALKALKDAGARQFYIKYCSTFDSTPTGNIGPVVDAAMDWLGVAHTVLDPALPINGRTVKDGVLYVNGVPLALSPMKDHPLNPMWASSIGELMRRQSRRPVVNVSAGQLRSPEAVTQLLSGPEACFVPDHTRDEDAEAIVRAFGHLPLLTGGSALAGAWGKAYASSTACLPDAVPGGCLLLAGSCSAATRRQIQVWQEAGRPAVRMDPLRVARNPAQAAAEVWSAAAQGDCLIYTSDDPDGVRRARALCPDIDSRIEQAMALLAVQAAQAGVTRWIVAGGETSGAVTRALGHQAFGIGGCVAPGVPVLIPDDAPHRRLILKSGNFGQEDFFLRAWERTNGDG